MALCHARARGGEGAPQQPPSAAAVSACISQRVRGGGGSGSGQGARTDAPAPRRARRASAPLAAGFHSPEDFEVRQRTFTYSTGDTYTVR